MAPSGQVGSFGASGHESPAPSGKSDNLRKEAKTGQSTREELLARFPDIADSLLKLERADMSGKPDKQVITVRKRTTGARYLKTVRGRAGYKSYKALDWSKLAQSPRKAPNDAKQGVVVSKTRRRQIARNRANARKRAS